MREARKEGEGGGGEEGGKGGGLEAALTFTSCHHQCHSLLHSSQRLLSSLVLEIVVQQYFGFGERLIVLLETNQLSELNSVYRKENPNVVFPILASDPTVRNALSLFLAIFTILQQKSALNFNFELSQLWKVVVARKGEEERGGGGLHFLSRSKASLSLSS